MARVAMLGALILGGLLPQAGGAALPGLNGRIVFSSNRSPLLPGELFSVSASGGAPRRLTSNWVEETAPAAAPTDGRIAFARGGWIFVRAASGDRAVARVRGLRYGPIWSRDGRLLLFTDGYGRFRNLRVFVVSSRGGARRRIGSQRDDSGPPAWSSDTHSVAFVGLHGQVIVHSLSSGRSRRVTRGAAIRSSLTWAPDGKRLAFFIAGGRGGVFVMRLRDGRTRRVVASRAIRQDLDRLSWAPRGDRLLAVNSNDLRVNVLSLDGRLKLVAKRGDAAVWSPEGSRVAYRSGANINELWVRRLSGGRAHRVSRPPAGHQLSFPTWRFDGRRLVYSHTAEEEAIAADLYAMRPDGSRVERLWRSTVAEASPAFSPDGSEVAYRCGSRLCVRNLATGRLRVVVSALHPYGHASWSPDGSRLVVTRTRLDPDDEEKVYGDLYVVGADGSGLSLLTRGGYGPAWSPDGSRIAFSRLDPDENLHVLDLGDGTDRNISDQPFTDLRFGFFDSLPDWAPDGGTLVFASMRGIDEDGGCDPACPPSDLFTLPPVGGEVVRLTHTQGAFAPVWSPDGRSIAYDEDGRIALVPAAGGRRRLLTRGPGVDVDPTWQPRCTRRGSARRDVIRGSGAAELLCGFGGNDTVVGGPGADRIFGGRGNDRLSAFDGSWDVVGCGPGSDTVTADTQDLVGIDCERVARR